MNKNTVLGWAALSMVVADLILIGLAAFKCNEIAGWGFGVVDIDFFTTAWVFNALKGGV